MAYTRADLDLASRHVAEGAERIADLRLHIALEHERGHSTAIYERALTTMLVTQELMEVHLLAIEASLARSGTPPHSG